MRSRALIRRVRGTFEKESVPEGSIVIMSCAVTTECLQSRNTPTESCWLRQYTDVVF